MANLHSHVQQVRDALKASRGRLVLAESCTAGRVAGTLGMVPGISAWLCGSFVVYRNESKAQWLNIPRHLLDDPQIGPVSAQVTLLLATHALTATPEANLAAAVTGHIGPGCPSALDGNVFFCMATRHRDKLFEDKCTLDSPAPLHSDDLGRRETRLEEATGWVLQCLLKGLEGLAVHAPQ